MSKDRSTIFISHVDQDFEQLIEEALRSSVNLRYSSGKGDHWAWLIDNFDKVKPINYDEWRIRLSDHEPVWQLVLDGDKAQASSVPPPPPPSAKLLLRYALPRKYQEHIIGDLEEAYHTEWLLEHGPRQARRLYWWHAIRSIAPMLWTGVKRSGMITFILGAADWLRDRFS